jgi:hypothetical protein
MFSQVQTAAICKAFTTRAMSFEWPVPGCIQVSALYSGSAVVQAAMRSTKGISKKFPFKALSIVI